MDIDELIKLTKDLQEEVAKNNAKVDQITAEIESLNEELNDSRDSEESEVKGIRDKWSKRRAELTKEISDASQRRALIKSSGESLEAACKLQEQTFRLLSQTIARQDVKDAIEIIRTKFESSEEELGPADFDEIEQQLGLSTEPTTEPDSESQAETG